MKIKYKIRLRDPQQLWVGKKVHILKYPKQWNSNAGGKFPGEKHIKYPVSGIISKILKIGEIDSAGDKSAWCTVNVVTQYGELGYCLETLEENGYYL